MTGGHEQMRIAGPTNAAKRGFFQPIIQPPAGVIAHGRNEHRELDGDAAHWLADILATDVADYSRLMDTDGAAHSLWKRTGAGSPIPQGCIVGPFLEAEAVLPA